MRDTVYFTLPHRIDESLKEAEQPQAAKHEAIAEAA